MATTPPSRPVFISSIIYRDNRSAIAWLQRAFGFEVHEVLTDGKDNIVHAEMSFGDGVIMIGNEFVDWAKSPASIGGKNTQRLHVQVERDIDAHYERAKAAGATIMMTPQDQFYGVRMYVAVDPDGHHWTFGQPVRQVSNEEMERATGFKYRQFK
ncbi:MAG TPA: VOC family protein [Steroidobacteraceae bacterium]|nr:VOC family protein [Steroidobacteraceae bacterium]